MVPPPRKPRIQTPMDILRRRMNRYETKHPPLLERYPEIIYPIMRLAFKLLMDPRTVTTLLETDPFVAQLCEPVVQSKRRTEGDRIRIGPRKFHISMDSSIGVNLRVTAHSNQGGRKYMEDMFCVAYQPTADEKDLLYAYFGIFDGHGGREAALYAKTHLMDHIVAQKSFWSDDDESVLKSIREGFVSVHHAMWRELDKWPKTQSGLPSTSGTTASVAFVRRGKLYIGHVGDSGIVLGYQDPTSNFWKARPLTNDHKPESPVEHARITECGGKVVSKSGVPRVVWNRPRLGHKGPVRRSTLIDEIPFLAVARSLGDLWSYNSEQDDFVVSPVPDTAVIEIDVNTHRCLILGSDGLWNMLTPQDAVNSVYFAEKNNERQNQMAASEGSSSSSPKNWINPSKRLVDRALDRWYGNNLRADNTSVVTVVIDPPGPPKKQPSPRHSATPSSSAPQLRNNSPPSPKPSVAHTSVHESQNHRIHKSISSARFSEDPGTPSSPRSVPKPRVLQQDNDFACADKAGKPHSAQSSPMVTPFASAQTLCHARQDRSNRRRKSQSVVSSKTSRVLAKNGPKEVRRDANANPPAAPGPSSPIPNKNLPANQGDVNKNICGNAVQINEISSSCEAGKAEGAETKDSLPPVEGASKAKKNSTEKVNKRPLKSTPPSVPVADLPQSSSRKRLARTTEPSAEEPTTQPKVMKVSNETAPTGRIPAFKKVKKIKTPKAGVPSAAVRLRSHQKFAFRNPNTLPTPPPPPPAQPSCSASNAVETKENGKNPPRKGTRNTRGNPKDTSQVALSNTEAPPVSVPSNNNNNNNDKPQKSSEGSGSQTTDQNDGDKVTSTKKQVRLSTPHTSATMESHETPSTSKRATRGAGLSSSTVTVTTTDPVKPPLKQKNALSSTTKKDASPVARNVPSKLRGAVPDTSKYLKVCLKRLKGKRSQNPRKEASPSRKTSVKSGLEKKPSQPEPEQGVGASSERNLRSSSFAASRVTRSSAKRVDSG